MVVMMMFALLTPIIADQAYMTVEQGNFLLSVPIGGSMTFIEGANTWTFADVASTAQSYTNAMASSVASTAAAQIAAALAVSEVCDDHYG